MKRELPIAVVLLALGCWLILRTGELESGLNEFQELAASMTVLSPQTRGFSDDSAEFDGRANAPMLPAASSGNLQEPGGAQFRSRFRDANVVPAAFQTGSTPPTGRRPGSIERSSRPISPDGTSNTAVAWLARARSTLANSKPFDAALRMESWQFGTHLIAGGKYYQQGQGGSACRLELEFQHPSNPVRLTQICDGQFMYQVTSRADQREVAYVDLGRLAQQSRRLRMASPQQAMTLGGLSGLIEQVMADFDVKIGESEAVEFCGVPVMVVRGRLKPSRKDVLSRYAALVRGESPDKPAVTLPEHVPDEVELYLGADDFMPGFPYRITFLRSNAGSNVTPSTPLVQFNFLELNKRSQVPGDLFLVESGDATTRDLTEEYASQLHTMSGLADTVGTSGN